METRSRLQGILLAMGFVVLAIGAVAGLVQLRSAQLGPEQRALESKQLSIARRLLLFENLDALEGAKDLPPDGGILTGNTGMPGGNPSAMPSLEEDAQAEWNRLPESEKAKIQESYRSWQALSPAEQRELMVHYEHFESLPPERRRQLIRASEELEKLSPQDRETRLKDLRGRRNL